jgi:hypothetical protein
MCIVLLPASIFWLTPNLFTRFRGEGVRLGEVKSESSLHTRDDYLFNLASPCFTPSPLYRVSPRPPPGKMYRPKIHPAAQTGRAQWLVSGSFCPRASGGVPRQGQPTPPPPNPLPHRGAGQHPNDSTPATWPTALRGAPRKRPRPPPHTWRCYTVVR